MPPALSVPPAGLQGTVIPGWALTLVLRTPVPGPGGPPAHPRRPRALVRQSLEPTALKDTGRSCPHTPSSGALFLAPGAEAAPSPRRSTQSAFWNRALGPGGSPLLGNQTLGLLAPASFQGPGTNRLLQGPEEYSAPPASWSILRIRVRSQRASEGHGPPTPRTFQGAGKAPRAPGPGLEVSGGGGRAGGSLPPTAPASAPLTMEPGVCTTRSSLERALSPRPPHRGSARPPGQGARPF